MHKRSEIEFLNDIVESANRIESYIKNMDYDKFMKTKQTQDAVIRNIEIIGEAVKNISIDFRKKHKQIEWEKIAGMRDKIIHFYFGVSWDIVWKTIKEKIPELKSEVLNIINGIYEK